MGGFICNTGSNINLEEIRKMNCPVKINLFQPIKPRSQARWLIDVRIEMRFIRRPVARKKASREFVKLGLIPAFPFNDKSIVTYFTDRSPSENDPLSGLILGFEFLGQGVRWAGMEMSSQRGSEYGERAQNMKKRPLSVAIVGWLFVAVGIVGFAYHVMDLRAAGPFDAELVAVLFVRLLAIVGGAYVLRGADWAR